MCQIRTQPREIDPTFSLRGGTPPAKLTTPSRVFASFSKISREIDPTNSRN